MKIHADGPCAFPHPVSHTYTLGANQGVDQAATVLAPNCPGEYTLVARAYVNASRTATHRARFTVEKPQKVTLQPGTYRFQLGNQVYVGDKIACVTASGASAGGGVIPTPGQGVSSSTGFNLQVAADGTVHITCPAQPGTM